MIREIKQKAWNSLRKDYWMLFLASIIVAILSAASSIIAILIVGPLVVGLTKIYLDNARFGKVDLATLFKPFSESFVNSLGAYLLKVIFIFLWTLLFIIPGIIKRYSYALVEYLIADNPDLSPTEAISQSKEMMKGNKMNLFLLELSFIGWFLLGILTLGIGLIFLAPYVNAAKAEFYLKIKGEDIVVKEESFEIDEDDYTVEWD